MPSFAHLSITLHDVGIFKRPVQRVKAEIILYNVFITALYESYCMSSPFWGYIESKPPFPPIVEVL